MDFDGGEGVYCVNKKIQSYLNEYETERGRTSTCAKVKRTTSLEQFLGMYCTILRNSECTKERGTFKSTSKSAWFCLYDHKATCMSP